MGKPAKSKSLRIIGSIEYPERSGEPGIHVDGRWYAAVALPLEESIIAHINPNGIRSRVDEFRHQQQLEPVLFDQGHRYIEFWAYRNKVVEHDFTKMPTKPDSEETKLLVQHLVLTEDRTMERIRREVQAFENFERLPVARREHIPKEVRLFVWQRDGGKCVECGSRERLEYDHIIPVIEGGSSTDRNVRLLCEGCNRRKGRTI